MKKLTHCRKPIEIPFMVFLFILTQIPFLAWAEEKTVSVNAQAVEDQTQGDNAKTNSETISLVIGDIQAIETKNLTRVSVTNPDIADISDAKPEKVLIVGKKPGQTDVFVWDDNGKREFSVQVASENLGNLKKRLQEVIGKAGIQGASLDKNIYEGKVVLSGALSKQDKDLLDKTMDPFSDKIINLTKVEVNEDLIQIDMQITELSTTLTKQIGLDWTNFTGSTVSTVTNNTTNANTAGGQVQYQERLPTLNGKPEDFFKIGKFYRQTNLVAAINALVQEGKGRILSKPRLVVVSGKEANFLVGGEVPILNTVTTAGGAGTTTTSTTFKRYGINMTLTPTVREGKIEIVLNVQISDIDKANADKNGDPAFITRSAQTHLLLDDMQTIALAGLIKHNVAETVKGIPFLSKVPIVGALFRTRQNGSPDTDTELVITLTSTILKSKKFTTEQVKLPSKRMENLAKEVESNFEKESMVPVKEQPKLMTTVAPPVKPVFSLPKVSDTVPSPYVRSIQLRISQAISYPYEALQKRWEGTVKLKLRILRDGTLADADVLESSGHDIFDKDAINTARIVAPFPPFPLDMTQEDLVVTVPIIYSQQSAADTPDSQSVVASY